MLISTSRQATKLRDDLLGQGIVNLFGRLSYGEDGVPKNHLPWVSIQASFKLKGVSIWFVSPNCLVLESFPHVLSHRSGQCSCKPSKRQMLFSVLKLTISIWVRKCNTFKGFWMGSSVYFRLEASFFTCSKSNRIQSLKYKKWVQYGVSFILLFQSLRETCYPISENVHMESFFKSMWLVILTSNLTSKVILTWKPPSQSQLTWAK